MLLDSCGKSAGPKGAQRRWRQDENLWRAGAVTLRWCRQLDPQIELDA